MTPYDRVGPSKTILAAQQNLLGVINAKVRRSGQYFTAATDRFPSAVLGADAAARLAFPICAPANRRPSC